MFVLPFGFVGFSCSTFLLNFLRSFIVPISNCFTIPNLYTGQGFTQGFLNYEVAGFRFDAMNRLVNAERFRDPNEQLQSIFNPFVETSFLRSTTKGTLGVFWSAVRSNPVRYLSPGWSLVCKSRKVRNITEMMPIRRPVFQNFRLHSLSTF
jgi:hypothetical protein